MRQPALRVLFAVLLGAVSASAFAGDDSLAVWQASQRASQAQQMLSDRYTALWSTLDSAQKQRFSAQERAWLNEGREREQQACVEHAGARTELNARTCEAAVTERHVASLAAPQRVVASSK